LLPTTPDQALDRFRVAWLVGAVAALCSAVVSSFHRRTADDAAAASLVLAPAGAS
jgi:hypothetical protein